MGQQINWQPLNLMHMGCYQLNPSLSQTPQGQIALFQVCLSLKDSDTSVRETRALSQAMEELSLEVGAIITLKKKTK